MQSPTASTKPPAISVNDSSRFYLAIAEMRQQALQILQENGDEDRVGEITLEAIALEAISDPEDDPDTAREKHELRTHIESFARGLGKDGCLPSNSSFAQVNDTICEIRADEDRLHCALHQAEMYAFEHRQALAGLERGSMEALCRLCIDALEALSIASADTRQKREIREQFRQHLASITGNAEVADTAIGRARQRWQEQRREGIIDRMMQMNRPSS